MDNGDAESDGGLPEDNPTFVDCVCEHDSDDHGWGRCDVDGCSCEGGWEE